MPNSAISFSSGSIQAILMIGLIQPGILSTSTFASVPKNEKVVFASHVQHQNNPIMNEQKSLFAAQM